MYVGKAPTVNESTNVDKVSQPVYRPIEVRPDMGVSQAINTINTGLQKIAQYNEQIEDYNNQTKLYTQLNQLSTEAELNKWTPEQYKEKLDNLVSKYEFNDEKTKLQVSRYISLHSTATISRLQAVKLQDTTNEAIANTINLGDNLLGGIRDTDSYMNAITTMKSSLDDLVNKGLLNSLKAEEYYSKFKKQAQNNLTVVLANNNPEEFLKNLKSGKYDNIFDNQAEKVELQNAIKKQILRQQQLQKEQEEQLQSQMIYHYTVGLYEGKVNIADILKDPNLSDKAKATLIRLSQSPTYVSPKAIAVKGYIEQQINAGVFSNLADFQKQVLPLAEKGIINTSIYKSLQDKYLSYERQEFVKGNEVINNYAKIAMSNIPNIVDSLTKTWTTSNVEVGGLQTKPYDIQLEKGDIIANAKAIYANYVNEICGKNPCNAEQMNLLAHKAVLQATLPVIKQDAYNANLDLYTAWREQGLPEEVVQKTYSKLIDSVVLNNAINPKHYYEINKIFGDTPVNIKLNIMLSPEAQKKAKAKMIVVHFDGKKIWLDKVNKNILQRLYGTNKNRGNDTLQSELYKSTYSNLKSLGGKLSE